MLKSYKTEINPTMNRNRKSIKQLERAGMSTTFIWLTTKKYMKKDNGLFPAQNFQNG